MGWRYRKRIKILPGIYFNISKSGISTNVGVKGASVTFGSKGTYVNTGLPGTGLYRRDKVTESRNSNNCDSYLLNNESTYNKITPVVSNEGKSGIWNFITRLFSKPEVPNTESMSNESDDEIIHEEFKDSKQEATLVTVSNEKEIEVNLKDTKDNNTPIVERTSLYTEDDLSDVQKMDLEPYNPKRDLEDYRYPTLDLLKKYDNEGKPYIDMDEQTANKNRIVELLRSFGIEISSIKATVGPRITMYEITLAPGLHYKVMRGLEDDLALALSAQGIRIMAPIPGKGTIGIEVPNARTGIVSLGSILDSKIFQESIMELPCAIGKTITNEAFMFDLVKAPHILIGGSTGQGKSVALHTIITSLLYKKHPAELKFVLMDPLGVEMGLYNSISNNFLAVLPDEPAIVSDSYQAARTLESLCTLMNMRYDLLKEVGARNIKEYNRKFIDRRIPPRGGHGYMPYIVVIIDSYSAFTMSNEQRIEQSLTELTKFSRPIGIHVIISEKRPSSDILSSEIKSYIPTRISFRVPEKTDSQIILDCEGAEQLIGKGDMLYMNGGTPIRVQCAFVDTPESERISDFISEQQSYRFPFELPDPYSYNNYEESYEEKDVDMSNLDPLFEDAARLIVLSQSGSTSLIQRKFGIGYNRANRLMNQLEKAGVVGAAMSSKPHEVIIQDEVSLNNLLCSLRW